MPTDPVPSCKQDTSDTEFQHTQDAPSEGVLSTPSIEFLSSRKLESILILLVPTRSSSHLSTHFSLIDNSLLLVVDESLLVLQLAEHLAPLLLLFVLLVPYLQSSPAAPGQCPYGNTASFPLELPSLPVLVVAPLREGPPPWRAESVLLVDLLTPLVLPFHHL